MRYFNLFKVFYESLSISVLYCSLFKVFFFPGSCNKKSEKKNATSCEVRNDHSRENPARKDTLKENEGPRCLEGYESKSYVLIVYLDVRAADVDGTGHLEMTGCVDHLGQVLSTQSHFSTVDELDYLQEENQVKACTKF